MFSRLRNSFGLALLLTLTISVTVFAKGSFNFIIVTGADLKEPVRITDSALTESFFAFANFFEDKTGVPANPGTGYEITRFYIDGKREIAFDSLHYYPDTGFVFYDGIINGDSEYDDEWYTADPQIMSVFENALFAQGQPAANLLDSKTISAGGQVDTIANRSQAVMSIVVISSLALLFVFAYRFRRQASH